MPSGFASEQEIIQLLLQLKTTGIGQLDVVVKELQKINASAEGVQRSLDKMAGAKQKTTKQTRQLTGVLEKERQKLKELKTARERANDVTDITNYNKQIKQSQQNIDNLTRSAKYSSDTLASTAKKVALWSLSTGMVYGAIRGLNAGIDTIVEVDSKMVDLQKVFVGTASELNVLKMEAADLSVEMGNLIGATLDAEIVLGRMGKTRMEISTLTRTALLAQNIAEIDAAEGVKFLNSAIKQFNMDAGDSLGILDEWNQLSNRMPVTTRDLAEAVSITGSIFHQVGAEIQDVNAYTAALATTMAKSGHEIGNALKTISSYAYRDIAKSDLKNFLDIDVEDSVGNLMDLDDILMQVALRWGELTEAQQMELAQSMAGVRRKAYFLNLMQNFNVVLEAYSKQWEAAGSAVRENEIRLGSLQTKLTQLQASLQKVAVEGGDTGLLWVMKGLVDMLRGLVDGFADANGAAQLLATGGMVAAILTISALTKKIAILSAITSTTIGSFFSWGVILAGLTTGAFGLSKAFESDSAALREYQREANKQIETLKAQEKQQEAIIDQFEKFGELYKFYNQMKEKGEDVTKVEENLYDTLDKINELNPDLVSSTDNLAEAYKRLESGAEGAKKKIEELDAKQRAQQRRLLITQLDTGQSNLDKEARKVNQAIMSGVSRKFTDPDRYRQTLRMEDIRSTLDRKSAMVGSEMSPLTQQIEDYSSFIAFIDEKIEEFYKESNDHVTNETKALEAFRTELVSQKKMAEELLHFNDDKPTIPPPGSTPKEDETKSKIPGLGDEDFRLKLAQSQGMEIQYWQEILDMHDKLTKTERQRLQNYVDYLQYQKEDKFLQQKDNLELQLKLTDMQGAGATDLQLVEEQRLWIEYNITDENEKQLALLELQIKKEQALNKYVKERQQLAKQLANDMTRTIEHVFDGWISGDKGSEIGAKFAEDIGNALGTGLANYYQPVSEALFSKLGTTAASLISETLLPGIGGALGGYLFSELGKLIGWEDKKKKDDTVQALDENTRALYDNTDAINSMNEQLFNAPTDYMLPVASGTALPSYDREGYVTRSGLAMVHQDEVVMKADRAERMAQEARTSQVSASNYTNTNVLQINQGAIQINGSNLNQAELSGAIESGISTYMDKTFNSQYQRGDYQSDDY